MNLIDFFLIKEVHHNLIWFENTMRYHPITSLELNIRFFFYRTRSVDIFTEMHYRNQLRGYCKIITVIISTICVTGSPRAIWICPPPVMWCKQSSNCIGIHSFSHVHTTARLNAHHLPATRALLAHTCWHITHSARFEFYCQPQLTYIFRVHLAELSMKLWSGLSRIDLSK